jgi:hypothetical protein
MDNQLPAHIQLSDDVLFHNLSEEAVLLDMETEKYFGFNSIAARFWELILKDNDTRKAIDILLTEYEVDEATLTKDIFDFLTELKSLKLLTF